MASFGIVQGLLVTLVGTAALGIHWDNPLGLAAVVVAVGVAAGCLSACVGTVLPSWPTGAAAGGLLGFVMGMIGGCLWPLSIVGPVMRTIGHLTPHVWALDALSGVLGADTGSAVAGPLVVLTLMSLGFAAIAVVGVRRAVNTAT